MSRTNSSSLHAQDKTLSLFIVGVSGEQWLDIALAMHTIEMIPKSMILTIHLLKAPIYSLFFTNLFDSNSLLQNIFIKLKFATFCTLFKIFALLNDWNDCNWSKKLSLSFQKRHLFSEIFATKRAFIQICNAFNFEFHILYMQINFKVCTVKSKTNNWSA
jgi:hypothetical protein